MNIFWFKKDLRINDNQGFTQACKDGSVLPLFIIEPQIWKNKTHSYRQYCFLVECLKELDKDLQELGQGLVIKVGSATDVFNKIIKQMQIKKIFSTQETGNDITYKRDIKLKNLFCKKEIPWIEFQNNGVLRGYRKAKTWTRKWYEQMYLPLAEKPIFLDIVKIDSDKIPKPEDLGLFFDGSIKRQKGGRSLAIKHLNSFLTYRGEKYVVNISSPNKAFLGCSRLSPYITFGVISIREIVQMCIKKKKIISKIDNDKSLWKRSIASFISRLRWHCHFVQKLEDNPTIEYSNIHSAFDKIRNIDEFNYDYFNAWKEGKTGYPFVDACMRCLKSCGWINFRMRAMLISFASYHLWLNWIQTSEYLASLFTDYEPGIHYYQVQMQSGTTGINSIRAYNPIKQSIDQDPNGFFIKRWIPELKDVPTEFIHEPWNFEKKTNYPSPIVNEKESRKKAVKLLYDIKKSITNKEEYNNLVKKLRK